MEENTFLKKFTGIKHSYRVCEMYFSITFILFMYRPEN